MPPKEVWDLILEDELDDIVHELKEQYPGKKGIPSTLEKLIEENPKIDFEHLELITETLFHESSKQYLTELGYIGTESTITWKKKRPDRDGNVVIPEGVVRIPPQAFGNRWRHPVKINSIAFPQSLRTIDREAFSYVGPQRENDCLVIPDSVNSIRTQAFSHCEYKYVSLPCALKELTEKLFAYSSIEEIIIPEGVQEIGYGAFDYCRNLRRIRLPESLKRISVSAFSNCENLKEISGKPLSGIQCESSAFNDCYELADENGFIIVNGMLYRSPVMYKEKCITIPETVTKISMHAFDVSGTTFRDAEGRLIYPRCREITFPRSIRRITCAEINPAITTKIYIPAGTEFLDQEVINNRGVKILYY